jgi:hypothetical protein
MAETKRMNPMTGDEVEVDGVYANEWGREVVLKRGDTFPADIELGRTTWELKGFSLNEATIDHVQHQNTPPRNNTKQGGARPLGTS